MLQVYSRPGLPQQQQHQQRVMATKKNNIISPLSDCSSSWTKNVAICRAHSVCTKIIRGETDFFLFSYFVQHIFLHNNEVRVPQVADN